MRLLVLTAARSERDSFLRSFPDREVTHIGPYETLTLETRAGDVVAVAGGVGPASAAAATATVLALGGDFDIALNVGIAGAFRGLGSEVGGVVIASSIVFADLGAWAPDGFMDLTEMGWGTILAAPPAQWVGHAASAISAAGLPGVVGEILTLSTMTGTDARAEELAVRHGAPAEAMEGAGMSQAAVTFGVPVMEVRTISNLVGERDRESWEMGPAMDVLAGVGAALLGEPWPALQ